MTPEKRKNKNRNFMFRRAAGGLEASSRAWSPSQAIRGNIIIFKGSDQ